MWPLLVLLIFGIAITIERLYNLSKAAINAEKFFQDLEGKLRSEGPDSAAELCSQTQGPVASVIHAGLLRLERGIDHVEKAIENAGAVEMAFLERGMVWLSTVANLAPMIGFLIQFFHNLFASRIDRIIADMQEHTAALVDVLAEMGQAEK